MPAAQLPRDVIPALARWGAARSDVRAMVPTSTQAIPQASRDALSDYDVILIVQELEPFVADRTWLNDFGEVLVAYWDAIVPDPDFGIARCGNVTQYADGLKLDFTLWPRALFDQVVAAPALPAELDAGYRVLLDKDQLTARLAAPTGMAYVLKRPSQAIYHTLINDFLSDAPYVAKCLWRDELLPAVTCCWMHWPGSPAVFAMNLWRRWNRSRVVEASRGLSARRCSSGPPGCLASWSAPST